MDLHIIREETQSVYLSLEEIEKIMRHEKLSKAARIVRDYFVIMCFTGLRHCDAQKLSLNNISKNKIVIRTSKTGQIVEIPISPPVRNILECWGDSFPKLKSQQNTHKILRKICNDVGIDNDIVLSYTQNGKIVQIKTKKYNLIAPHTGRRSFCTNLYLASEKEYIPLWRIMLMTGHKHESSFLGYVRITRSENVQKMGQHPFFNTQFLNNIRNSDILEAG